MYMQKTNYFVLVGFLLCFFLQLPAQETNLYKVSTIDTILLEKANAVVRSEEVKIEITSVNAVTITTKRVVTV